MKCLIRFILSIFILFLSSCQFIHKKIVKNCLIQVEKEYPGINKDEWYLYRQAGGDSFMYYELKAFREDTLLYLLLYMTRSEKNILILDFKKIFFDQNNKFELKYYNRWDTVYLVRYPKSSYTLDSTVILKGRFSFYHAKGLLNWAQDSFYLEHKDSIIKYGIETIPDL